MKKENNSIVDLLKSKSILKQEVYKTTLECYKEFRELIEHELIDFRAKIPDERVRLKFDYNGDFETHAYVGSDVLVFNMHSNVFTYPDNNPIWKNSYIEEDKNLGYFGVINIYNFLADSFLHTRLKDAGYLIGRIFINKDRHFIIEGKGELSYYFRNIRSNIFDKESMKSIFEISVKHAANFDLHTPPFNKVSVVNVHQIKTITNAQEISTGKRLGFKFEAEINKK